jgi:heme oxygenase (mycobilin-producing)
MRSDAVPNRVRVVLWCRESARDPGAVQRAYREINDRLAGTPGLLGSELLRSQIEPRVVAVLSEWASMEAFLAWEKGPDHRDATAPLRPHQDKRGERSYDLFQVTESVSYRGNALDRLGRLALELLTQLALTHPLAPWLSYLDASGTIIPRPSARNALGPAFDQKDAFRDAAPRR